MKTRLILFLLLAAVAIQTESCRPRTAKTSKKKQPPQTAQQGPSAKQVMSRADSALANLNTLSAEDKATPKVSESDYPRTEWGSEYTPQPDKEAYHTFESGLGAFNAGNYDKAIGAFSQIAANGTPVELVPNAYYWIGESFFAQDRYAEAIPYFEYTASVGPAYRREAALYKLSAANNELGNAQAAGLWYERLRAEYPKSAFVAKLKKMGVK
jgi:TolA-binding protein